MHMWLLLPWTPRTLDILDHDTKFGTQLSPISISLTALRCFRYAVVFSQLQESCFCSVLHQWYPVSYGNSWIFCFFEKRAHQKRAVLQETMTFGKNFNQKLDNVQLPENLQLLRPSAHRDRRRMNGKKTMKMRERSKPCCNSLVFRQ